MSGDLLTAASQWSDHETGVDEIEGMRLQLALEQVIDDELHVGDPLCLQKRPSGIEQALVDVGAHDLARGAGPLAKDPKPAHRSAADVEGAAARSGGDLRQGLRAGRLPDARLKLQALQLRRLVGQQIPL